MPHPLGAENIRSIADAVGAICKLRRLKPELRELVIKLDSAVSGEGNAVLDLTGMPAPGTHGEHALLERRLARVVPEVDGVTADAYLHKLAEHGGVVEGRITGRELHTPSVQLRITPVGAVELISTLTRSFTVGAGNNSQDAASPPIPLTHRPSARSRCVLHSVWRILA